MNINDIKNPDFLKKLAVDELESLAKEMRDFLIATISKNGGHLSSNLGIVELTIALLKVFDVSKDIILFDVSHQCYPYKILTGRINGFENMRKKGGMSGFQSSSESIYDHYEAGHASTSISTALGMAYARDLNKDNYEVISVIGDGSFNNGLVYEALNELGEMKTKQIVILNDNGMSISKNVGALSIFLDKLKANKNIDGAKRKVKKYLSEKSVSKNYIKSLNKTKKILGKVYLKSGTVFDNLGIDYLGPINGHDFKELITYLKLAKSSKTPVLLHVVTEKGKGLYFAENDKIGKYHGVSPFDIKTGNFISKNNLPSYSEVISSYVYNYAKKDKDIICITPGMCLGSCLENIKEKLPKQFIDVGMAEEHGLLLANGLALSGKKPFVFIYSSFLQRGYDEVIHDIARMKTNVTICIDRAGFVPNDGASHQGLFDVSMLMHIPNMIITSPKDSLEANNLIYTALNTSGPFAIRYPKTNIKYDFEKASKLKIGSWEVLKNGTDGVIISYGDFVLRALNIATKLEKLGISIMIINARFIKPIDEEMFKKIVHMQKPIFVYEEAMKIGALGSYLSMIASDINSNSKVHVLGVKDEFLTHASRDDLIKMESLDELSIIEYIADVLKKA